RKPSALFYRDEAMEPNFSKKNHKHQGTSFAPAFVASLSENLRFIKPADVFVTS
ncbi:conserved hypothetical protein, partial [delta proteobacterium NaphS2]